VSVSCIDIAGVTSSVMSCSSNSRGAESPINVSENSSSDSRLGHLVAVAVGNDQCSSSSGGAGGAGYSSVLGPFPPPIVVRAVVVTQPSDLLNDNDHEAAMAGKRRTII
jgi:hypothetical protein